MEMTLRGANDVQAFTAESRLPVLPLAALPTVQSETALQPNMDCLPFHSVMHGQVMTDEQLETLRLQISVYATICQQLVEMHKAIMAQQSIRSGQPTPYDSVIYTMGHKLTSRQRWNPRQTQLQILEILFEQGNGTPNKQRIKEITAELSQHGPISETNVYNWFQNRRARTKRKQQVELPNTGESEVDTDVDSKKEKKVMREKDPMYESLSTEQSETNFRSTEGGMGTVQVDDRYWLDSQRILHSETIHAAIDVNPGAAFRRAVSDADEHGYAPRSLQDSQGQMVSKNWAEESLKLLHSEKNHSLAGLGNGDVTAKTIPSEGILKPSAEQVSGIMREVCLIGLNNGSLVCNQSQSQLRG